MRLISIFVALLFSLLASAQTDNDTLRVEKEIEHFFARLAAKDTAALRQAFSPEARLNSIYSSKGQTQKNDITLDDFLHGLAGLENARLEERVAEVQVMLDYPMAVAWVPYKFYFNGNFSHCGVNVFLFLHKQDEWRIESITDTRRNEDCKF